MSFRRDRITKPIHKWARTALPSLSDTEAEAISAGEIWWEADLFSGNPDWTKLRDVKASRLTAEEQTFLSGPCRDFCAMVDDWKINHETADLPDEAWQFLRDNGFFGMIIPKEHGGMGFSAYAHSEVIRYISSASIPAAVTVMVPNSLGPGELILQFGTDAQKEHWLPRLAAGKELPAFGLTSEEAGSDASAMVDTGVVCKGDWNGQEVLGLRLNWAKRYITLAPVCTVLGLAFQMRDPDGLLGGAPDIGITCALVPTDLPGVETGRRHIPSGTMFMNGPTTGKDVFIPLENIIGGPDYAGRGWMMLMAALAAGRGISLPSLSAAATAVSARSTGAYARVRQQFNLPIGKFGGVQEKLGLIAANAYAIDAARRLTCAGLDQGHALAVISAIMKYHATTRMRTSVEAAMDVHSGKAVIDGPLNYLGPIYRSLPIGITVEGANIVTRNLIIFGQGAIRAHPHLLDEMQALQEPDPEKSLDEFDRHFWAHVKHSTKTTFRALGRAWSGALFAPAPPDAGPLAPIYRRMARWSAAFALTADMAFLTMGGALKRREMISARMGDVLSELYFLSAIVKRWEDEGRNHADLPLVQYNADAGFARIQDALDEVVANFPARWAAWLLRFVTLPGMSQRAPDDALTAACSDLAYHPSATRERLTSGLHKPAPDSGLGLLEAAYDRVTGADSLTRKLRDLRKTPDQALADGVISQTEHAMLQKLDEVVQKVVAVDEYTSEELAHYFPDYAAPRNTDNSKEAAE